MLVDEIGFVGSYVAEISPPSSDVPNRHAISLRHGSSLPDGCVFALIVTDAAPTPCSRIGFHITSISLYVPGPTTIMSPALALLIAVCSALLAPFSPLT
ncbi:hypothetical protein BCO37747_06908 [Burkholderia contaminans]|nr:hypothetical protein BCO23253_06542 [Burkholderia contaminans]VWD57826.1 hypothetical protein BCO37747_06908 [Burkholderia contaminans]